MRKNLIIGALCAVLLTGCSAGSLPGGDEVLFSVGEQKITKNDMYSAMSASGTSVALNDAINKVVTAEIEVTDEMREKAEADYEEMVASYGDYMNMLLDYYGVDKDTYIHDYILIPNMQDELTKRYVEENTDSLVKEYEPFKIVRMNYKSEAEATSALSGLTSAPADDQFLVVMNGETSMDEKFFTAAKEVEKNVWTVYADDESSTYAVYYVTDIDTEADKDLINEKFISDNTIIDKTVAHYLAKHKFKAYNSDLIETVKSSYPDLVK